MDRHLMSPTDLMDALFVRYQLTLLAVDESQ